jgi:hypothetical protein
MLLVNPIGVCAGSTQKVISFVVMNSKASNMVRQATETHRRFLLGYSMKTTVNRSP